MSDLTHFNNEGRSRMVDVSDKDKTIRKATAGGIVYVNENTYQLIVDGGIKKGDVLAVAQVAGIMAAKKCSDIIPMCHPIILTGVDISYELNEIEHSISITAEVKCTGETGVEMEALTAVSTAALTIYDMCKAVQRDIKISEIRLISKSGGKSGDFVNK